MAILAALEWRGVGFAARLELLGVIRNRINSNSTNSNSNAILAAWRGVVGRLAWRERGAEPDVSRGVGRDWDCHSNPLSVAIPIPYNASIPA